MAKTRAQENREIRQEAIRTQLANQGHIQHVIEIAEKLNKLKDDLTQVEVTRLRAAAEIKLKLIDKYLPSLKSIELDGNLSVDPVSALLQALPQTTQPPSEREADKPTKH